MSQQVLSLRVFSCPLSCPLSLEASTGVQGKKYFILSSLDGGLFWKWDGKRGLGGFHDSAMASSWPVMGRKEHSRRTWPVSSFCLFYQWGLGLGPACWAIMPHALACLPMSAFYSPQRTPKMWSVGANSQPWFSTIFFSYFPLILLATPVSRKASVRASPQAPMRRFLGLGCSVTSTFWWVKRVVCLKFILSFVVHRVSSRNRWCLLCSESGS